MTPPQVSIIMPSYNSAEFIGASIDSILAQSYALWELVVVDDCSSDDSCEIVERYAERDSRIRLIRLTENSGAAVSRNLALDHVQGRYIAFCDSDDRWMPEKLERQLDLMSREDLDVCYSSYIECDERDENLGVIIARREVNYREMIRNDYMGFLTFIFDTHKVGRPQFPLLKKRQDWAYKLLVMQKSHRAKSVMEPLAYYRVRRGSLSNQKMGLVTYNLDVYRKVLHFSPVKAWAIFLLEFMPRYIKKRWIYKISNK
ncbi:MAG: glycosyltransferase family 2 protein [Rikenellaceae bacterium]